MAKVKLVRMGERSGLMRARMAGVNAATAEVNNVYIFNWFKRQRKGVNYLCIYCLRMQELTQDVKKSFKSKYLTQTYI